MLKTAKMPLHFDRKTRPITQKIEGPIILSEHLQRPDKLGLYIGPKLPLTHWHTDVQPATPERSSVWAKRMTRRKLIRCIDGKGKPDEVHFDRG